MNLKATHYLTVTLSVATNADVFASWRDLGIDRPDSGNTKIEDSAAETTVVAAPGSGLLRRITDMQITIPRSSSSGAIVTVEQTDGTTSWEVTSANLQPGDSLIYSQQQGWKVRAIALDGNSLADLYQTHNPAWLPNG